MRERAFEERVDAAQDGESAGWCDVVEAVGLFIEAVAVSAAIREAAQNSSRRRDEHDRARAGDDQLTGAGEAVWVEAASGEHESLGVLEIGEVDPVSVGGEREAVRSEGDAVAVARVEVRRAPDDAAV